MSSHKSLVVDEVIDHAELIGEDVDAPHDEMTSIHNDNSSTAQSGDDGDGITAAAVLRL